MATTKRTNFQRSGHAGFFLGLALLLPVSLFAGEARSVRLAVPAEPWAAASSGVAAAILEEHLGFIVELVELPADPAATEPAWDILVAARFPDTHAAWRKKPDYLDLGPNLTGLRFGIVVPANNPLHSVDELNERAAELDFQILGPSEEKELLRRARRASQHYGLDLPVYPRPAAEWETAWNLAEESTGWIAGVAATPGWAWAQFDLRFLDDPEQAFGKPEALHNLIRSGFAEKHEVAANFLRNFRWTLEQANRVSHEIYNGADPREAGREWAAEEGEIVARWLSAQP